MSIEEQKKSLDILWYELFMLNNCFDKYENYESYNEKPINEIFKNVILESFLIHVRCIYCFLTDEGNHQNGDIRLRDFNVFSKIIIKMPERNTKHEIDKYLAHITIERIEIDSPDWKWEKMKNEINRGFKKFLEETKKSIFPSEKGRSIQDFIELIDSFSTQTSIKNLPIQNKGISSTSTYD